MNYFSTKYKINDVFSDFHSKKGFILCRMQLAGNVFVYGLLLGLAPNLANKNRIENPRGLS